jgi:hypothetical protein
MTEINRFFMACKIAVLRRDSGRKWRGDCVAAFDIEKYLGNAVEPQGGAYVVIEVNDCDKENETIQQLVAEWNVSSTEEFIAHAEFDREYYLEPITEEDQFFADLFNHGRINVTLDKLKEYIRVRNG